MLDARDLRIGNWVDVPNKGFTQILSVMDIEKVIEQQALPIPTSKELILSLGFLPRSESNIYEIASARFVYHVAVKRVMIYHPGNMYTHWLGSHIDYIHQLQNIFYCITGYDLTLSPPFS
jgi:hypothetical protein